MQITRTLLVLVASVPFLGLACDLFKSKASEDGGAAVASTSAVAATTSAPAATTAAPSTTTSTATQPGLHPIRLPDGGIVMAEGGAWQFPSGTPSGFPSNLPPPSAWKVPSGIPIPSGLPKLNH